MKNSEVIHAVRMSAWSNTWTPTVVFNDSIERVIAGAVKVERWWQAQYLKLDRLLVQMRRERSARSEALPIGQLGLFDLGNAA